MLSKSHLCLSVFIRGYSLSPRYFFPIFASISSVLSLSVR